MTTLQEIWNLQWEIMDELNKIDKCGLCSKRHDERNGLKLCTDCYIKAQFDIEGLMWHDELMEIREYVEYKKIAVELGNV